MRALSLGPSLCETFRETLTLISHPVRRTVFSLPPHPHRRWSSLGSQLSITAGEFIPISDEALMGFITGKRKATEVAHSVWKNIIQRGDTVIDATCGNGYDTLALLKLVADKSRKGCVYGLDIQTTALESTSSLLDELADQDERKLVTLCLVCHSKMEDAIPKDTPIRLVAFNLGYLPGGDKAIITRAATTLLALQAASRILASGGLISMVVYVGHPGGRDELETVLSFASSLPMGSWASCKLEMLNRPTCPVLVFLFKK